MRWRGRPEHLHRSDTELQPPERNAVDGHDFVIPPRVPLWRRGRSRQRLQNRDLPGVDADDGAESLGLAPLHLLELLELIGVEKNRVRIKRAQHAGDRALIKGLIGRDGIGRLLVQNRVYSQQLLEIVGEPGGGVVVRPQRPAGSSTTR